MNDLLDEDDDGYGSQGLETTTITRQEVRRYFLRETR